jgi:hypothetical protein
MDFHQETAKDVGPLGTFGSCEQKGLENIRVLC